MSSKILLLVDGHCNLCHSLTQFVIRHDKNKRFVFASLQSKLGQRVLADHGLPESQFDTVVMLQGQRFYTKSSAALRILKHLGGWWSLLYVFIMVPAPIRHWTYDQIAKRRYRWFGRSDECILPTPELTERFVDEYDG